MDEEIEIINTNTRVEKLKNFLISKRKQLITSLILIILILITFFGYQEFKSSSKEKLANKFNSIVTNFETGKKENINNSLIEIINTKDKTYSPLAFFFLLDNDLITSSDEINSYFDLLINEVSLEKEIKNLTIYKKGLFNSEFVQENELLNILNPVIKSEDILPKSDWYKKFEKYWEPSEQKARENLDNFVNKSILNYGVNRDFPSIKGTSLLSPYIRNGQINVGDIWQKCKKLKSNNVSIKKYTNEIGWREFSHSLINYFPQMLKGNLRKEFDKFPWVNNSKFLNAWKKGMTGYPIVDAGMRELYETGWMHNRIRMVVGSFLVKHLRINWKEGEKYFRNCLLDFNEANNVAQWQWVAGCGADAAPYFRIFNPILQGEKFDKQGDYVKKWVPELSKVPPKYIHKPWEMEKKYQEAINTIIGSSYPMPIVVHEKARADALSAFQSIKKKN